MARVVGVPLARNSAAHRRALQLAFERCATPLVMGTAKKLKPPTRVCVALPLGAPTILSCAAAGVSGGLTGAVNAVTTKSKLDKIEARTVEVCGSPSDDLSCQTHVRRRDPEVF